MVFLSVYLFDYFTLTLKRVRVVVLRINKITADLKCPYALIRKRGLRNGV